MAGWTIVAILGCGTGSAPEAPFEVTAFHDLAPVAVVAGGAFRMAATADGRELDVVSGRYLSRYDIAAGGALVHLDTVEVGSEGRLALQGDVRTIPRGAAGAAIARRDGDGWVDLAPSTLPSLNVSFSEDYALVTWESGVSLVDRDTWLAGEAGPDDVISTVPVPINFYNGGEAGERDGVLWAGASDGAVGVDITDPSEPIMHLGNWLGDIVRVFDDMLVMRGGYDLLFYDVTDVYQPRLLGHAPGGGNDFVLHGGFVYGVDRDSLTIVDVRDPAAPTPVGWVPLGAECSAVAVTDAAVFVACGGEVLRLEPNTP